jgi:YVTN family beta-propeller protein
MTGFTRRRSAITPPQSDPLSPARRRGDTLYLELTIDGVTLSPREKILSAPYAIVAGEAQGVANGSITSADIANNSILSADIANGTISSVDMAVGMRSTLDSSDGSVTPALSADTDGNIGIGTEAPAAGLQIDSGVDLIAPDLKSIIQDEDGAFTDLDSCYSAAISGDFLFIAGYYDNAISVVDISDPGSPQFVTALRDDTGGFNYLDGVYWLEIDRDYLYASSLSEDAVSIIDISNPTNPTPAAVLVDGIAGYNYLNAPRKLCFHENYLYIPAENDNAVTIVDVSDPYSPIKAAEIVDGSDGFSKLYNAYDIACEGDYAYVVAEGDEALTIIDISTPSTPQCVAEITRTSDGFTYLREPKGVEVSNGYVFIAASDYPGYSSLIVVDCSTPSAPVLAASIQDNHEGFYELFRIEDVSIEGNRLYMAAPYSITVADISNPSTPVPVVELTNESSGFEDLNYVRHIVPDGDLIYAVCSGSDSVYIIDVSTNSTSGTVGLYVNGRVGINTPLPKEALDVRGNIIASYDITAGSDLSAGYSITAGTDVTAGDDLEAGDDVYVADDLYLQKYSGGDSGRPVYMDSNGTLYPGGTTTTTNIIAVPAYAFKPDGEWTSTTYSYYCGYAAWIEGGGWSLNAPVYLPHGAEVVGMTVHYWDNDSSYDLDISLVRQECDGGSMDNIAIVTTAGANTSVQTESASSVAYNTIDNSSYTYHMNLEPDGLDMWSSNLKFYSASIEYTLND